jgi:hypothetical protein
MDAILLATYVFSVPEPNTTPLASSCHQHLIEIAMLRIRDVYPGFWILNFTHPGSRIPDRKIKTKDKGEKNLVVIPFL